MAASKRRIIQANSEYYFQTYAKTMTRGHLLWSVVFIVALLVATGFIALGFLRLAYIGMAAQSTLDQDVVTWVNEQMWGWRSATIVVAFAMGGIVLFIWALHYWKTVKSYDLYKKKWRFFIFPLATVLIEVALAFLITLFLAEEGTVVVKLKALAWSELGVLTLILIPLLSGSRLFVPWEITPLPKEKEDGWKKVLNFLKAFIDIVSKLYLAGK